MKNVLIVLTLVGMFAFAGCKKSPESHCAKAVDHGMELMMNSPMMKKMPKKDLAKMKEGMKAKKAEGVKECVKDYNKDSVDCIIKADSIEKLGKCNIKK